MYYRELADVAIPDTCISIAYAHDFSQKVVIDICSSLFLYISVQSPYQNSSYWKNFQISLPIPTQIILRILNNKESVKAQWEPRSTMPTQHYRVGPTLSIKEANGEFDFYPNLAVKRQCLPSFTCLNITFNNKMLKTVPFKLGMRH